MVVYFIVLWVFAVVVGIMFLTGHMRRDYIAFLVIIALLTLVNMNAEWRGNVAKLIFIGKKSAAVDKLAGMIKPDSVVVAPIFKPFYVYQDKNAINHFTPSGLMPSGECTYVDDAWQYSTKNGSSCLRVIYDTACSNKKSKWAGLYWQNPPNNWGAQKGGYDLTGATKLTFWAKGEVGGELIAEFKVGGLGANQQYPDSTTATIANVTLSQEWQQYSINLSGKNLSYISGGFAFSVKAKGNLEPCIFYLDEIRFE